MLNGTNSVRRGAKPDCLLQCFAIQGDILQIRQKSSPCSIVRVADVISALYTSAS